MVRRPRHHQPQRKNAKHTHHSYKVAVLRVTVTIDHQNERRFPGQGLARGVVVFTVGIRCPRKRLGKVERLVTKVSSIGRIIVNTMRHGTLSECELTLQEER